MDESNKERCTRMLEQVEAGQAKADELLPVVYDELRSLARARMAKEKHAHTMQPTMLVHEAYLRLVGNQDPGWNGRGHFFGAAALAMRRILVEQARRRGRIKHGAGKVRVEFDQADPGVAAPELDVLAVDEAVEKLEALDERKARLVELRWFGGLTMQETADALEVSLSTAEREWRFTRAWLQAELQEGEEPR